MSFQNTLMNIPFPSNFAEYLWRAREVNVEMSLPWLAVGGVFAILLLFLAYLIFRSFNRWKPALLIYGVGTIFSLFPVKSYGAEALMNYGLGLGGLTCFLVLILTEFKYE